MTTEKALREALQKVMDYPEIRSYMGSILANYADAALSLPETQGEPVAGDVEWLHKFINCTPFGADAPAEDMQRAHRIVDSLYAAPPSQPAQGWRLVPVELLQLPPLTDAMYHAVRGLELEFSSGGPESVMASINDETLDEIWDAINTALRTSKAMLAAAPAGPTQAGAFKIGDTVTKVTGDYHLNAAPQAVLPPETKPDKTGRDAGDQQEAQPASAAPSFIATPKPTNGEGA